MTNGAKSVRAEALASSGKPERRKSNTGSTESSLAKLCNGETGSGCKKSKTSGNDPVRDILEAETKKST